MPNYRCIICKGNLDEHSLDDLKTCRLVFFLREEIEEEGD